MHFFVLSLAVFRGSHDPQAGRASEGPASFPQLFWLSSALARTRTRTFQDKSLMCYPLHYKGKIKKPLQIREAATNQVHDIIITSLNKNALPFFCHYSVTCLPLFCKQEYSRCRNFVSPLHR